MAEHTSDWTEWSRYVLEELKRLNSEMRNLAKSQDEMADELAEYNAQLAVHIRGVQALEAKNDLIRQEVETFKEEVDSRLKVAEQPIIWARTVGNMFRAIVLISTAAAALYGLFALLK